MVDEDLAKSYKQLLVDIHEELLGGKPRSDPDRIKHSLKRISSLFAKMGMDSQKTQKWIMVLSIFVVSLTALVVALMLFA